jgi:hypothetical protein
MKISRLTLLTIHQRSQKPLYSTSNPMCAIPTADIIQRIRAVVRETETPSWLNSVPDAFGAASAGSLKADEWRTLCTVYIPLALISLWGQGLGTTSTDPQPQYFTELLALSMSLICAVRLACLRVMTPVRATAYLKNMVYFLSHLRKLIPHASFRTNDHIAMHIYDFLLLFGPVRSWWCFPFERLIGLLQRLPQNHKFGIGISAFLSIKPTDSDFSLSRGARTDIAAVLH